ncbi:hypothetical protein SKAU_G00202040 [Synaphobranchus kaupii]|uniref:Uncharacterized protein n=1 Tax=Synaphobranchus kaupii TaxID=118154 RepID=A0A9Q1FG17_SYNKA|nr:hypothetical protein SKAU_G00202040 [Synaphobranchus kaupii]
MDGVRCFMRLQIRRYTSALPLKPQTWSCRDGRRPPPGTGEGIDRLTEGTANEKTKGLTVSTPVSHGDSLPSPPLQPPQGLEALPLLASAAAPPGRQANGLIRRQGFCDRDLCSLNSLYIFSPDAVTLFRPSPCQTRTSPPPRHPKRPPVAYSGRRASLILRLNSPGQKGQTQPFVTSDWKEFAATTDIFTSSHSETPHSARTLKSQFGSEWRTERLALRVRSQREAEEFSFRKDGTWPAPLKRSEQGCRHQPTDADGRRDQIRRAPATLRSDPLPIRLIIRPPDQSGFGRCVPLFLRETRWRLMAMGGQRAGAKSNGHRCLFNGYGVALAPLKALVREAPLARAAHGES